MNINLTYTKNGDYLVPDLALENTEEERPLGKYGRMRKKYLQEHRPALWNTMILNGSLFPHLREVDETANRRLEEMLEQMSKEAGLTESMKSADPLKWIGTMNSLKAQAEEIIYTELIYS